MCRTFRIEIPGRGSIPVPTGLSDRFTLALWKLNMGVEDQGRLVRSRRTVAYPPTTATRSGAAALDRWLISILGKEMRYSVESSPGALLTRRPSPCRRMETCAGEKRAVAGTLRASVTPCGLYEEDEFETTS
jgi:hypothetical protein